MTKTVALEDCPIGLFLSGSELCLKTEYGDNAGRIDAYIVGSGEFFWGGADTIAGLRKVQVLPVDATVTIPLFKCEDCGGDGWVGEGCDEECTSCNARGWQQATHSEFVSAED